MGQAVELASAIIIKRSDFSEVGLGFAEGDNFFGYQKVEK